MNDDLIRRSDVKKAIFSKPACHGSDGSWYHSDDIRDAINSTPSADRPQGEWKHLKGDEWLCSNCGYVVWTEGSWEHPLERGKDYCEHCGAKMKGANNE